MVVKEFISELRTAFPDVEMEQAQTNCDLGNNGYVHVYPKSEDEIVTILQYANEHGKKIVVQGNGSKKGFGGEKETADILLSLSKYKGIVEHGAGDMTVTVKSGTSFQELQEFLSEYKQQVSLDPSWPKYASIGGVIASNDSGPKRLGYGSARDAVIGLRIIYPDGTIIRSGGKVVKNVAGYDMNKMYIGSMGTLGVFTEVTLKLRPLPKKESVVLISFPEGSFEDIHAFAVKILDSMMEPVSLEFLNPSLAQKLIGKKQFTLAISFEDVESSVDYQVKMIQDMKPDQTTLSILLDNEELQSFWNQLYSISPNGVEGNLETKETEACLKVGVKNLSVLNVIRDGQMLQDSHNLVVTAHGGLGHGICQLNLKGAREDVASVITNLCQIVGRLKGYVIIKHAPLSLRQEINVWGDKPTYLFLMEGIKSKIDPNHVLNEKRFLGGI
ncbi:FAD-binding oxidoreductase [Salipaludibacillus neizhouensis]|uniref:FAD-binding oxidoreductase n=1 Tax=Salipaludibacillus neizhouensis TaxID=885475 RepID=A0A3A9KKY0_9BACI|nr:FAD-binding oxidoreductase [Salipaludibacillus neizhouensis]RKL65536.1 FAD-binding oxidoreductase [Salipaludibacillus neizhouensis]